MPQCHAGRDIEAECLVGAVYVHPIVVSTCTLVPPFNLETMSTFACADPICSLSATNVSSAAALWKDDPVSASFQLFSLIEMKDRFLKQVQTIDAYILELTEKIVRDADKGGHVGHGLLLLNRKCVAEGVRQVYLRLATHKWKQARQCYNVIRQNLGNQDHLSTSDLDESHDHEVTKIARGLSMECCAFQRPS